jgi:hypothetical protein
MGYPKIKPNMHGTGGGRWTTREEAKHAANKVRRRDDGAEVQQSTQSSILPRAGMITLAPEHPLAKSVEFAGGAMRVALEDGRRLEVPIAWFPRLREATPEQREDLRLIGGGIGIHWPQLDEDLSIRGLLFPHPEDAQRVG